MLYIPLPIGRICRSCGLWKPEYLLKRHKEHPTGRDALCRQCNNVRTQEQRAVNPELTRAKDKQYRRDHLDKARERDKKRRDNPDRQKYMRDYMQKYNVDNRECLARRKSKYAKEHPEMFRNSSKKWVAKNRGKVNAKNKRYQKRHPENAAKHVKLSRQRHPETKQAAEERRRARKRNLPDTFTTNDWRHCLEYWYGCCAVCGRPAGLWHTIAADHWIPLSNPDCPGTVPENILPLCHSQRLGDEGCNNIKWKFEPVEWLEKKMGSKRKAAAKLREIEIFFATVRK